MALLAESLVDEWLNRQGFFTVRGIRHGVGEIDLLGVRPCVDGLDAWHVEVQASLRPIGYISPLTEESLTGFAKSRTSMKARSPELIEAAARAWVKKKFLAPGKQAARDAAWPGLGWEHVLVHAEVREPLELKAIETQGVRLVPLHVVLSDLEQRHGLRGSAGTDLSELMKYFFLHSEQAKRDR